MQKICSTKLFSGLLLFACVLQACYSHTVSNTNSVAEQQLLCYVCDDCTKITKSTPLEVCDATYFEKLSTTEEPTNDPTTSTEANADSSTTTELSTTTTTNSTDETTTTDSTTEAVPTAPTVGVLTTTTVPTPPAVGTVSSIVEEVEKVDGADNAATTTESALNATTIGAPQALPYIADDYSYHCFSVQKIVNGTASVDRGCSRVTTMESVCGQLRALNNGTQLSKCVPCSNSSCNGSSALAVSVAALMFTLVAALLNRK